MNGKNKVVYDLRLLGSRNPVPGIMLKSSFFSSPFLYLAVTCAAQ
jgi:hypothetical protein